MKRLVNDSVWPAIRVGEAGESAPENEKAVAGLPDDAPPLWELFWNVLFPQPMMLKKRKAAITRSKILRILWPTPTPRAFPFPKPEYLIRRSITYLDSNSPDPGH